MSNQRYDLTRRKVLGSLGVIGAGAALGGAGTMAFFSDEENFEDNKLVAGELDLKVDWEEHYSDWSDDEGELGTNVLMSQPSDTTDWTPVPTAAHPMLWVENDHLSTFMANTTTEVFPDYIDNPPEYDAKQVNVDGVECDVLGSIDTPETNGTKNSVLYDPRRTNYTGAGTMFGGQRTDLGDPVIDIEDVKPGDFGEVTYSLHLCDNPGYIWVNGKLTKNAENGVNEVEANDPDEDDSYGPNSGDHWSGELADEIIVALWYDHGSTPTWDRYSKPDYTEGDNIMQGYETAIEHENVVAIGSLRTVMELLEANNGLGIPLDGKLGSNSSFEEVVPVGDYAATDLTKFVCEITGQGTNPHCADYGLLQALSKEEIALESEVVGNTPFTYTTPAGTVTIESINIDGGTVTLSTDFPVSAVIMKGGNQGANVCKADGDENDVPLEDGDGVNLDNVTFETAPNTGSGELAGISRLEVCYDGEVPENGNGNGRDCFVNSTTAYIGFAWWLPVNHANEIQSDKVKFDLGFYTEQCRHNDGSGMAPEGSA